MGRYSGYDRLAASLSGQDVLIDSIWPVPPPFRYIIQQLMNVSCYRNQNVTSFYGINNFWAELCARRKSLGSNNIVHIMYGENNLGLYSRPAFKLGTSLVVTAHQPIEWWRENGLDAKKMFATTNALIVLSRAEQKCFREVLDKDCVHYIPHGVDTDFFCPEDKSPVSGDMNGAARRFLFVGQWLRDFDTLFEVIERYRENRTNVEFDLVVPDVSFRDPQLEKRIQSITVHPQVKRHQNLDDASLRELYRKATILFLPLEESTANNAILEAMACGLPIVSSETSGMCDYVNRAFAHICPPKDAGAMSHAADELSNNEELLGIMSIAARKKAVDDYDWRVIGQSVQDVYLSQP
jgi:glycosyltransferase involved in cell wall biosynthesis